MTRRAMAVGLLVSVGLNVGLVVALALRRPAPRDWRRARSAMTGELGLDARQEAALAAAQSSLAAKLREQRERMGQAAGEMTSLLLQPHPDRQRIDERLERMARIQRESQEAVIDHLVATRTVLTPEQHERLVRMMVRRGLQMGGPGGGHGRGRKGPGGREFGPQGPQDKEKRQ